jgi:hypothetical protein
MNPCPYCGAEVKLVGGEAIYPHRPDLFEKRFWQCAPCQAYVGCHGNTTEPLGRLANAELRQAKMAAHRAFDPLWREYPKEERKERRKGAYAWLSKALNVPPDECHIGMFDEALCRRVVEVCEEKIWGKS